MLHATCLYVCLISKLHNKVFSTCKFNSSFAIKNQNFLFMDLLQFRKRTFMQICPRTLYSHIILPNLNTVPRQCALIFFTPHTLNGDSVAPALTVALLSRRYIVKEDYLVRKFSSLASRLRDCCTIRSLVRPVAISQRRQSTPSAGWQSLAPTLAIAVFM